MNKTLIFFSKFASLLARNPYLHFFLCSEADHIPLLHWVAILPRVMQVKHYLVMSLTTT